MEARWFRDHQREPSRTWVLADSLGQAGTSCADSGRPSGRSSISSRPASGPGRREEVAGGGRSQDWQSCGRGFESRELLRANLEQVLGRPADELPEGVAGEPGLEISRQGFPHVATRWHPLLGVGPPFSVPVDGSAYWPPERIPYAFPFLHRL